MFWAVLYLNLFAYMLIRKAAFVDGLKINKNGTELMKLIKPCSPFQIGAGNRGRTCTGNPMDPKSIASASSAIPANQCGQNAANSFALYKKCLKVKAVRLYFTNLAGCLSMGNTKVFAHMPGIKQTYFLF